MRNAWMWALLTVPLAAEAAEQDRHEAMQHEAEDHADMDHSGMDHSGMDHSGMDHSGMDHSGMDHSGGTNPPHSAAHPVVDQTPQGADADQPAPARSATEPPHVPQSPVRNPVSRLPADSPPPTTASTGPRYAADALWGADAMSAARAVLLHDAGHQHFWQVLADRLEWRDSGAGRNYLAEIDAWYGGDYDKLWLKLELAADDERVDHAQMQALWSRAFTPYFDWQLGVRYDFEPDGTAYLAAGVRGMAPYRIEMEWGVFLSDEGDLETEWEAEHDYYLTQRLIAQPRAELALSSADHGAQLATIGLRIRYELKREIAPYVGYEYSSDVEHGEGEGRAVAGLRFWF